MWRERVPSYSCSHLVIYSSMSLPPSGPNSPRRPRHIVQRSGSPLTRIRRSARRTSVSVSTATNSSVSIRHCCHRRYRCCRPHPPCPRMRSSSGNPPRVRRRVRSQRHRQHRSRAMVRSRGVRSRRILEKVDRGSAVVAETAIVDSVIPTADARPASGIGCPVEEA